MSLLIDSYDSEDDTLKKFLLHRLSSYYLMDKISEAKNELIFKSFVKELGIEDIWEHMGKWQISKDLLSYNEKKKIPSGSFISSNMNELEDLPYISINGELVFSRTTFEQWLVDKANNQKV